MRHERDPYDYEITPMERFCMGFFILFVLLAVIVSVSGCVYRGAKIVEGTDLAVGINVPSTEGALQLQLMNYLSGFRLGVAENAGLVMTYSAAESNDYFGIIHTRSAKEVTARVQPRAEGVAQEQAQAEEQAQESQEAQTAEQERKE